MFLSATGTHKCTLRFNPGPPPYARNSSKSHLNVALLSHPLYKYSPPKLHNPLWNNANQLPSSLPTQINNSPANILLPQVLYPTAPQPRYLPFQHQFNRIHFHSVEHQKNLNAYHWPRYFTIMFLHRSVPPIMCKQQQGPKSKNTRIDATESP